MSSNFDPNPKDSIKLFGRTHIVQPHPRAPHMPYSQLSGRAVVHQLRDELGGYFALKVFKKQYRDPNLINATQNLRNLESFEGLRAATRRIVMPTDPAARTYRNLEYAMLMSWVHGKTWYDVLGQAQYEGYSMSKPGALRLCSRFLQIMEGLETAGVAHTDISPGHVSVELLANDVQLLGLEDVYMPGATAPNQQSTGSAGYRHRSGDEDGTLWRPEGDRYAAAVLAAEMLVLANPRLARNVTEEGFFRNHSGTPEGRSRFDEAQPWLEEIAPEFAYVFERSWIASSLQECPKISELKAPIKELANSITSEESVDTSKPDERTPPSTSDERTSPSAGGWGKWEPLDSLPSREPSSTPTPRRGTRGSPTPSENDRNVVTWSQERDDKKEDEPGGSWWQRTWRRFTRGHRDYEESLESPEASSHSGTSSSDPAHEQEGTYRASPVHEEVSLDPLMPDTGDEAEQEAPPAAEQDQERYADFTFYPTATGSGPVPDRHPLQAEQWYRLEVAVRMVPTGIPPEATERRPILEPEQQEEVRIMVAAEGDGFEIEEPVQVLLLPARGDSTDNVWFQVRPQRRSTSSTDFASIRVRLYYQFNLIEVALICAEVVGVFEDPADSKRLAAGQPPIWFRQERLERRYMNFDDMRPRAMHIDITRVGEDYQFTFAFYNDVDDEVVFAAPVRLRPTDLEDTLAAARGILYRIAMSKPFTDGIEGDEDEFLADVRTLARAGRTMWGKLFRRDLQSSLFQIGRWLEEHPLKPGGIFQVSVDARAADFVLPWTLLYDREIPKQDYQLPDLEGFWGIRYCVEQQLPYGPKRTDAPIMVEDTLSLDFMLWEHFRNAEEQKSMMTRLVDQTANRLKISIPPITDAAACYDSLKNCDSHVVYFYTHGHTRRRRSDIGVSPGLQLFSHLYESLEGGDQRREAYSELYESIQQGQFEADRSWIELTYGKVYLDDLWDYVSNAFQHGPLVALNMCESAQITPALSESFIEFFLDRGATSVIGTECPMTVEFAHPFSERLLEDLLKGEQVGMAMLKARRYFMNERRNPLGLAYSLFGSATLRFDPSPIEHQASDGHVCEGP